MNLSLSAAEWTAVMLSLKVSLWCTACLCVPGVAVGWLLARREFPGKALLDSLVHLPLVLPPVVPGYLLLLLLGSRGPLGRWLDASFGIRLAFTWQGAVIAAAVMAFPLMVRAVRLSIELVDRRLEDAARSLGAAPWRVFATITLPLALPGLLTGLVLAFSRSLGEFGATITFVGNIPGETRTLALAIYSAAQTPGNELPALRLVLLSLVLALGALYAAERLAAQARRRLQG